MNDTTAAAPEGDAVRQHTLAVIEAARRTLLAHDMSAFADLWAPDGTLEFPFAAPGAPRRLSGREEVRAYLADYTDHIDLRALPEFRVHPTLDPRTAVVEMRAEGFVVPTGRPYELRYVAVVTVEADGISSYRDYWSPLAAAEALGDALPGRGVGAGEVGEGVGDGDRHGAGAGDRQGAQAR
ncbi:nuclear transport factor 2 family protein [Allostreptomyces psammosilenae]|uniref:SnoaL-like domain-containing protein n=1 Tax=Allostreptomyces psammosilenae TaxID=1892865 RepID=A0A853AD00_9ACTN|nr:nuclear transport factor 2 family protein [Allostreptomyces psammosilenae]NYI08212.1 hypothetical protein [Allostreptomyces psammosilenae]